jgi:CRISPR/Cas system-associated exonuclease Cas4 (RecB family)
MMAGIETEKNEYMIEGSRIHDIISKGKLNLIPEISDSAVFEDIVPEEGKWTNYFKVELNEWLVLSMVVDVLDSQNHMIVDWKASTRRSTEHNKMQIYLYAIGVEQATGVKINSGVYGTVSDHDGAILCDEYSMFKINDNKRALALNYAETVAGEIYDFIHSGGIDEPCGEA